MNHEIMKKYIRLLKRRLEPHGAGVQFVFLTDCCRAHIHKDIATVATLNRFHLIYVPARLTFILQPLDAYVFQAFKRRLRQEYSNARIISPEGLVEDSEWLRLIFRAITVVFGARDWSHAFRKVGAGERQACISDYIRQRIGPPEPHTPPVPPAIEDIQYLGGHTVDMPYLELFRGPVLHRTGALASIIDPAVLALEDAVSEYNAAQAASKATVRHAKMLALAAAAVESPGEPTAPAASSARTPPSKPPPPWRGPKTAPAPPPPRSSRRLRLKLEPEDTIPKTVASVKTPPKVSSAPSKAPPPKPAKSPAASAASKALPKAVAKPPTPADPLPPPPPKEKAPSSAPGPGHRYMTRSRMKSTP